MLEYGEIYLPNMFYVMQVIKHWKMKLDAKNPIGIQLGFDCIDLYMNLLRLKLNLCIFLYELTL